MRKRLYALLSSFLLIVLCNSAYAYDGQSNIIFETDASNDEIYFVEFDVGFITPESLPPNPGTVSVIRTSDNTVVDTVDVGESPQGVAVTPDGNFVYVTNPSSNNVSVIQTSDNTVVDTVDVGANPFGVGVTPNGNFVYVANIDPNNVSVIEVSTNTVVDTVDVGATPTGVGVTPNGNFAYVANSASNNVSVIRTSDNTVVDTVDVGATPIGVGVTPDGNFVYVANSVSNNVSVIRTSDNTVVDTVDVGATPIGVGVTPDGNFVYVANSVSNNVSVIRTSDNTVVDTVDVEEGPQGLGVTPDGNFVYVANNGPNNVSVIQTSDNTVVDTVDVGEGPQGVAVTPDGNFVYVANSRFTVFLWPGLQPGPDTRKCFYPINNGVLQPVLTYGNSCAPHKPQPVERWWISGQYVNTFLNCDSVPDQFVDACESFFRCHGGPFITVVPKQEISTSMVYRPAAQDWLQTIEADGQTQTYSIALNYCSENSEPSTPVETEPQSQTRAILSIETKGFNEPLEQTYENILLKIQVGDDPMATCDNTLSTRVTFSSSSCTPFNTISNANGILTCQIDSCTIHKATMLPGDSDNDGVPNEQDADADNDGIPNAAEDSGNPVIARVNGNKHSDVLAFPQQMETVDTDGDGIPNFLDLDSDGDGIPDHFEAGGNNDANLDGRVDSTADSDGDGLVDAFDPDQGGSMLSLPDTDGDGAPDFLDTDSDNDGISDTNETMGCVDANGDGKLDDSADANGDGLADSVHPDTGTPCALLDTDGDGLFDHLDSVDNTSQGGGCSVAPAASPVSTLIYLMLPFFILIRRLWRGIRYNG